MAVQLKLHVKSTVLLNAVLENVEEEAGLKRNAYAFGVGSLIKTRLLGTSHLTK